MTCNDVLGRLRYIFDYGDADMVAIFAAADHAATEEQVRHWLVDEENPLFAKLYDRELATFLNGLINHKRGKRPGPSPVPENRLTNNLIATKLKIALNLKGEDILDIMGLVRFRLSKHELSSFFRKPDHKHYRDCKDQILRNFLKGLQLKYRPVPE